MDAENYTCPCCQKKYSRALLDPAYKEIVLQAKAKGTPYVGGIKCSGCGAVLAFDDGELRELKSSEIFRMEMGLPGVMNKIDDSFRKSRIGETSEIDEGNLNITTRRLG